MKKIFLILISIIVLAFSASEDKRTPIQIARSIADRIINDTSFELRPVIQTPQLDIQVLNPGELSGNINGINYALSTILVNDNCKLKFGLSYNSPLKIWINNKLAFGNKIERNFHFKEIAYSIFEFQDTIEVELQKGTNRILIKTLSTESPSKIYLREISEPDEPLQTKFIPPLKGINSIWVYTGPFIIENNNLFDESFPPESGTQLYYQYCEQFFSWKMPKQNILLELSIKEDAAYKRESFVEWMYPNGTVLFSLEHLANSINERKYSEFIEKVFDYTVTYYELFRKQYYEFDGFRSANHRLYRMGMLDDASAPALPYINAMLNKPVSNYKPIVDKVLEYVSYGQSRLSDGTLCRPEPKKMTVWADDLFMSVPFLVRAAKLYNNQKLYDDAAKQIINFNKYLFDKEKQLYKHAWFDFSKEKSVAYWGRANGWIIWATSDAMLNLPQNHKNYNDIKKIFSKHIDGLIKVQNENGMWHQLLDRKDSFEETSCTAMFIIGLARGIKNGWIKKSYEKNLMLAWNALKSKISEDGVVRDITRGTGIGNNLEFYFKRERFNNDPRGLGAVLTAAVEMEQFLQSK
jgi:rhamnogalacturonyl hydrolase YesR